MKAKFYLLLITVLAAGQTFAQCGNRYMDTLFSDITVTTDVVYTTANGVTLMLDVYRPTNDTATNRPLIIMAHGGSFVEGNKSIDPTVVSTCRNFAKRGYVTASINYRLASSLFAMLDSSNAKDVVMKAISDGKSAIRFFRKDAANGNTYGINPNIIFAGGNSAGAVLFSHVAYIDSMGELSQNLRDLINANGGLEGNSGNDGYSSKIQGLINYAGGLNIPELVGPGNTPSANFHGDQDPTVPYGCANAVNGSIQVRLCGLGAIQPLLTQYNLTHVSHVFPGDGHVPWQSNASKFQLIDTTTRNFLYTLMCSGEVGQPVGINDLADVAASVRVFPNPAKGLVNISFGEATFKSVELMDAAGRVIEQKAVDSNIASFNRNNLAAGFYFVRALQANGNAVTKKLIFE